jgi:hypothetical protein
MAVVSISVEWMDYGVPRELVPVAPPRPGDRIYYQIPGPAQVCVNTYDFGDKSGGPDATIDFLVTFGSGVATSLVASWIWDALKRKPMREFRLGKVVLKSKDFRTEIDADEVKRLLVEHIEKTLQESKYDGDPPA